MKTPNAAALLGALGMLIGASAASATTIQFNDFSDTSRLTLNGSAATTTTADGRVLRVTPSLNDQSGSAFSTAAIIASNFTMR